MRRIPATLFSLLAVLVLVNALTERAIAQNDTKTGRVSVNVCNKGEGPVEVVVAQTGLNLQDLKRGSLKGHWEIIGSSYRPGQCREAFYSYGFLPELFLGFGFKNSRGRFISGVVRDLPDWGEAPSSSVLASLATLAAGNKFERTLSRSNKSVCVASDSTEYKSPGDDFPEDDSCRTFSVSGGNGGNTGPFYPLTLGVHFFPTPEICRYTGTYNPYGAPPCAGGDYYINIAADPASAEVTFKAGTEDGKDVPPPDPRIKAMEDKIRQQFFEELRKTMAKAAEDEKNRQAAADPMARAAAARKEFEERQSKIDYNAEHTRNLGRIRDLAHYSPDWLRSTEPLYIRGTVSRVEMPTGRQPWARFYFSESPDAAFVACVYAALFSDLQHYAGQRVEVRGMVGRGRCGANADVQVNNPSMIYELAKGMPPDEEILPGMKTASSGNAPSAMAAATRLRVTLSGNIDLQHATNNQTFQGRLAAPVTLPDGVIPQGAAVVLEHNAWARLGVSSVTADGKIWRVSTKIDGGDDASVLRAGTTLVFVVAGTDRAVVAGQ
jgi:hypothetical protein